MVTTDQGVRGGKVIELKATVDIAVSMCPKVKRVFVSKRTGANVPMENTDIPLEEVTLDDCKSSSISYTNTLCLKRRINF